MDIFDQIVGVIAGVPDWVPLLLYPAVLVTFAVLVLTFGGRRAYVPVACGLGAAAFALLCCKGDVANAFAFAGMYAALACILKLFFFLPPPKKRKRGTETREERMYRKFCGERKEPPRAAPAKVCRFEEERASAADCGLRLEHAEELLSRLRKSPLTAADRLETDVIARSLHSFRERELAPEELRSLNDCLASVLKLTAKYKL